MILNEIILNDIIKELLNEAVQLNTGKDLLNAMKKGQIQGVSFKNFFKEAISRDATQKFYDGQVTKFLQSFLSIFKNKNLGNNFNNAIMLALKKIGTWHNLLYFFNDLNIAEWADVFVLYYANKNKQLFKTDEEAKKYLENFESGKFNSSSNLDKWDKHFESWMIKTFAKSASIKDKKELGNIYSDKGWEVYTPSTYAASKKLACSLDSQARWCTASNPSTFENYTKQGKLFIIINKEKNIMFQTDWGTGYGYPTFKNKNNKDVKVKDFFSHNPPDDLLKIIKNKKGKSIFDFHQKFVGGSSKKELMKEKDDWKLYKINGTLFIKEFKKTKLKTKSVSTPKYVQDLMRTSGGGKNFYSLENKNGDKVLINKTSLGNLMPIVKISSNGTIKKLRTNELPDEGVPYEIMVAIQPKISKSLFEQGEEPKLIKSIPGGKLYKIETISNLKHFTKGPILTAISKSNVKKIKADLKGIVLNNGEKAVFHAGSSFEKFFISYKGRRYGLRKWSSFYFTGIKGNVWTNGIVTDLVKKGFPKETLHYIAKNLLFDGIKVTNRLKHSANNPERLKRLFGEITTFIYNDETRERIEILTGIKFKR